MHVSVVIVYLFVSFSVPQIYVLSLLLNEAFKRSSSIFFLDELGWESLENKRLKQLAKIMYKIYNNTSPSYLRLIFTKTSNVHEHNPRYSDYRGSVLWDKIPVRN